MVCVNDTVWEIGFTYCWNCVNENVVLINQYYSRLNNEKQTKLYKQRLEYLVNVIHQCLPTKIPLFMLRKAIKLYLSHNVIDIGVMQEQHFKLLVEQVKNYMLNIESGDC